MNKKYLAPQIEVATLGTQSIICASAPEPKGSIPVLGDSYTDKQW